MKITTAEFVTSSAAVSQLPATVLPEYAFIGRSNVGKSSLINMLVKRKELARTSSTPGKTQTINHFIVNKSWYIADLPGYGFAKVSRKEREKWKKLINGYLAKRKNLVNVFVLVDSRIEPQKSDVEMINRLGKSGIPITILFTKADKLTKTKTALSVQMFFSALSEYWEELPGYVVTSAHDATGRDGVLDLILAKNEHERKMRS